MSWEVKGFTEKEWNLVKKTVMDCEYVDGNDYFGCIRKGAVCFDLVLRDVGSDWLLCADAFLLGLDTDYGKTKKGTPYSESDGFCLEYYLGNPLEKTIKSFLIQVEEAVGKNSEWKEYSERTDLTWAMEDDDQNVEA